MTVAAGGRSREDGPRIEARGRSGNGHAPTRHPLLLGAELACLEVRAVLEALIAKQVELEPVGAAVRTMNPVLRGFTSVPVGVR